MSVNSVGYLLRRSGSENIHRYSPPLRRIIVKFAYFSFFSQEYSKVKTTYVPLHNLTWASVIVRLNARHTYGRLLPVGVHCWHVEVKSLQAAACNKRQALELDGNVYVPAIYIYAGAAQGEGLEHSPPPPPPFPLYTIGQLDPYLWFSLRTYPSQKTKRSQKRDIFNISNALPAIQGTHNLVPRALGTSLSDSNVTANFPGEYAPGTP